MAAYILKPPFPLPPYPACKKKCQKNLPETFDFGQSLNDKCGRLGKKQLKSFFLY